MKNFFYLTKFQFITMQIIDLIKALFNNQLFSLWNVTAWHNFTFNNNTPKVFDGNGMSIQLKFGVKTHLSLVERSNI